jgi:hypothetical protein
MIWPIWTIIKELPAVQLEVYKELMLHTLRGFYFCDWMKKYTVICNIARQVDVLLYGLAIWK